MSDTTIPPQFTSVIGDPFDPAGASNLHQPGFLGVSPDVWRSLANFGSNMATSANARTPGGFLANGTGFAGPFAAAVGESNQQGLARGQALSDIGYRNALAQSQRMNNYVTAMNLPLQMAQNNMILKMLQDPKGWAAQYGFGAPTFNGGAATASGDTPEGGSDFYKGISKIESGGKADAQNGLWTAANGGPLGTAQFTGDTWLGFARENPQYFQGKSTPEILAMRADPKLQATATDWYAAKNASVLQQQGIDPTPQNLGIAHALGGAGAANVLSKPDQTPLASVMSPQVLQMNPQYARMTVGDLKAKYAGIGAPSFMTAQNGQQPVQQPVQQQTAASQPPASDANPASKDPSKMTDQEWLDWQSKTYPNLAGQGTQLPSESPVSSSPYQTASNAPVPPPSQPAPQQPAAGQPVGDLGLVRMPNGNVGTPAPQQAQTATAPAPMPQPSQQPAPQQPSQADVLMTRANNYEQQANQLENQRSQITVENTRRANFIKTLPAPMQMIAAQSPALQPLPMPPGDPAALRTAAQQFRQNALELQNAGPVAGAKKAAEAPYNVQRVPPGGILYNALGQPIGAAPLQSHEVIGSGPNAGTEVTVLRDPRTNQIITGGAPGEGGQGSNGLPSGAIQTKLPPQQEGRLKAQGEVEADDLKHDRATVEGDLEHVIDSVTPAKQQLFQLRSLVDSADTGAAGQFRSEFRNWVQTFAPDFVSKITGDASPAQEFDKIALMGAGKQERGDLGARGGFRAIEMYRNANPSMDKTPQANHDMANALLISHQYHEDYAMGAVDYYQKNRSSFLNPNAPGEYKPISSYDPQFTKVMRPELYAAAIGAINGKPYAEWAKGMSNKQIQIIGGIVQRADPSAVVDIQGHQVPVSNFKTTIGPTDIAGAGGPGAG